MVRTMIRSIQRCDEEVVHIGTQAPGRGRQSGGSLGGGRRGGGRGGRGHLTEPDPIDEEGDDPSAEESWLGIDWVLYDDSGRTPRCTSSAGAGPSHNAGHSSPDYVPRHPTPPLVHVDPTMLASSPTPHEEIPAEDIEPMKGLRRSRRPLAHAPSCGTDDGKIRPVRAHGRKRKDH
nr:hypothetical protein CFP56_67906 [Quercus suber]